MTIVYLRLRKKINAQVHDIISLDDIAFISTTAKEKQKLGKTVIYKLEKSDQAIVVIDSFIIINHLNKKYDHLEFELIGPTETIINIESKRKKTAAIYVFFVWLLLFIGTAMTIMNFHYDVSMQEVQQKLHLLFTGEEEKFPLWIQIPYSFGLGLGMVLYLNHWFKKRFNEEPSPLEVELYNYQLDLDGYVKHYENQLNDEKHGH